MEPRERAEARLGLAMLPTGAVLVVIAAAMLVAAVVLAIVAVVDHGPGWQWYAGWGLVAAGVSLANLRRAFETTAALDTRGAIVTLAWMGGIVGTWPGWWLG